LDLYEYQGKSLFAGIGVPVPEGRIAESPGEAKSAAEKIGGRVVVKAQVQVGGRGKAGGIKVAADPDEAASIAAQILGMDIKGHTVHRVWVESATDIKAEYYASFTLDRGAKKHLAMVSAQGGVDIEQVAVDSPHAVVKLHIDPVIGLAQWQARQLVYQARLDPAVARPAAATLQSLYRAFVELDCDLVEINPLVVTTDDEVMALDAKVTIDSNALYRHPEFEAFRSTFVIDPIEKSATDRGLNFIKLDGSVGVMANGAGLAMATLDVVDLVGGAAANFLDVGGGANAETITDALEVLTQDDSVRAVLINIFGGIVRCDLVAEGIVEAMSRTELPWPLVVRLDGTNAAEGRALLSERAGEQVISVETMRQGAERAVELAGAR
jgi:succinyl-CoA synthetase beta subunit